MLPRVTQEAQASEIRVAECVVAIYRAEAFVGLTRLESLAALERVQASLIRDARREELGLDAV